MTKSELHKLQQEYLSLGGTRRSLDRIGNSLSLRNEARLKYEISKLKSNTSIKTPSVDLSVSEESKKIDVANYKPKVDFKDYISEYPPELHPVYLRRRNCFLEACSIKVKLNSLKDEEVLQASKLQWKIWGLFKELDKCDKILDHWKEHKRVLPSQTTEDFTEIPHKKLNRKLLNLRSNRTKRAKTIQRMKENLPEVNHPDFNTKYNLLNNKIEALQELELQIEKLTSIINND